ncbi:MAG: bifunctional DNA primase/polymerase, partial [Oscillospiraceae bacterium]|nr:bifunctional DNA primase/polymerase [Oscillospiraceae bacterium]
NIAVVLAPFSPYFILDIDGPTGMTNLRRLQIAYGKLPTTYTVQTPSGGRHYYFTHDPKVKRTIGFLASHIDTITNGYCLIPPSTINGKQYTVLTDAPIVPAPAWLIKLASNTSKQVDMPSARPQNPTRYHYDDYRDRLFHAMCYMAKIPGAVQGQAGHTQLLIACRLLAKFALDECDAQELLVRYNQRCSPPWDLSNPREARDFWRKWRIANG